MALLDSLLGPVTRIIDKVVPDPEARDRAKLERKRAFRSTLLPEAVRPS